MVAGFTTTRSFLFVAGLLSLLVLILAISTAKSTFVMYAAEDMDGSDVLFILARVLAVLFFVAWLIEPKT